MRALSLAALAAVLVVCATPSTAWAQSAATTSASHQHTRYLGTPDLALTAAVVQAGGGPEHFDAAQLVGVLAGANRDAEVAHLTQTYGEQRVSQFLKTFTFAIGDALLIAQGKNVALPAPSPDPSTADGRALSAALFGAGTMTDGRFDIGYMLEHLISRPIHVQLMHDINANVQYGPRVNADFHIILTTAMYDLKAAYGL